MYGFINKGNSQVTFYIRVEGFPEIGFGFYTLRSAIKEYRNRYGLRYKHIEFLDMR